MYICRIEIDNFRNFAHLELDLHENTVIVGENKIGKSNLIYALRLILDPKLSESDRQLRLDDFWDGAKPLSNDTFIRISVDITDFDKDESLLAILAEHLVQPEPMVSRLTYLYRPKPSLKESPKNENDYEFLVYGGNRPENIIGYEVRKWIPLSLLPALRNAEEDLASWSRSPLAPLLKAVTSSIDSETKKQAAAGVTEATKKVAEIDQIKQLAERIQSDLKAKVGEQHAIPTSLGFSPTDADRLFRSLKLFIDNGERSVGDASLGSANLLYLTLLTLELERQVQAGERSHTFLAIEEPEAHLHPHIQRLVFRDFLATRNEEQQAIKKPQSVLLTTHSPHIVSVTPLRSIAVLRKSEDGNSTVGKSTAKVNLDEKDIKDLERYLDTKRGEIVFAKGVLLVEGPAEEFIVPKLAKLLGVDFDEMGISVCSVDSTNFPPYVRLLHQNGLNLPFAIITDLDPNKTPSGISRTRTLIKIMDESIAVDKIPDPAILGIAPSFGVFLNNSTLEIELFRSGNHEQMCNIIAELSENGAACARAIAWRTNPSSLDSERFLKDIEEVGKGRYAQRLASVLSEKACPSYIEKAITYVRSRIR